MHGRLQFSSPYPSFRKTGFVLVEAMVSILIFSIGIIGIIALQAVSVTNSSEGKYRSDASFLADALIGQMWADNRRSDILQANFQGGEGTDGIKYTAWMGDVAAQLPSAAGTVRVTPQSSNQSVVLITLSWTMPDGTSHNYRAVAGITQFNQ